MTHQTDRAGQGNLPWPIIDRAKLKRLRREMGWTQEELAGRTGGAITRSTISRIENGRRQNLRTTTLQALAKALGVTADDLLLAPPQKRAIAEEAPEYLLRHAILTEVREMNDEELGELRDFVRFLRFRRRET